MPCAESSTICARRQVTTDPELRRTIRSSRLPSSLLMARTCTRCTISHLLRGRQDQTRPASITPKSATRRRLAAAALDTARSPRDPQQVDRDGTLHPQYLCGDVEVRPDDGPGVGHRTGHLLDGARPGACRTGDGVATLSGEAGETVLDQAGIHRSPRM